MADQYGDKIKRARQAGYSDEEIVGFLAKSDVKVKRAVGEGYDAASIIGHLTKPAPVKKASFGEDVVRSGAQGLGKAATGLAGAVGDARELGMALGAFGSKLLGASPEQIARGQQNTRALSAVRAAPTSNQLNQRAGLTYQPQTRTGRFAEAIGQNAPAALVPGSAGVRAANVLAPAIVGEGAGQAVEAMGGSKGMATGARIAGSLAGAGLASIRPVTASQGAANTLRGQNPQQMAQRAAEYRAAGINPAAVDLIDDSGRGVVRAAATRQTPGRQIAGDLAANRAVALPDRIGAQARRVISADPRPPQQVIDDLVDQQANTARTTYAGPYAQQVQLTPEAVSALSGDAGRAAIQRAMRGAEARRDVGLADELRALADGTADTASGAALDRIQIAMRERAQTAMQRNAGDVASGLHGRRADINQALDTAPGLSEARGEFRNAQRNIEAAEASNNFLRPGSADEYANTLTGATNLTPSRAVAARAVERAAGENTGSAPGIARRIADAPEQQARNRALLGEQDATRLQDAMRLEGRMLQNASDISPRVGSKTAPLLADMAETGANTLGKALRQDWVGLATDWLRSRGMNDRQAQALIEAVADPARADEVVAAVGEAGARRLQQIRNVATVGALTAPQSQQSQ